MIYPTQHSIAELFNCSLFKVFVRKSWKDLLTPNTKKRDRTVRGPTMPAAAASNKLIKVLQTTTLHREPPEKWSDCWSTSPMPYGAVCQPLTLQD